MSLGEAIQDERDRFRTQVMALEEKIKHLEFLLKIAEEEDPTLKYLEEKLYTKGEHSLCETIDNTIWEINRLRGEVTQLIKDNQKLAVQNKELEKGSLLNKNILKSKEKLILNFCHTEVEIEKAALAILTEKEVYGDSYGVPGPAEIVDTIIKKFLLMKEQVRISDEAFNFHLKRANELQAKLSEAQDIINRTKEIVGEAIVECDCACINEDDKCLRCRFENIYLDLKEI